MKMIQFVSIDQLPPYIRKLICAKFAERRIFTVDSLKRRIEENPDFLKNEICAKDPDLVEDIMVALQLSVDSRKVSTKSAQHSKWNLKFAAIDLSLLEWDKNTAKKLGQGSFASVYLCMYDGQPHALKHFENIAALADREKESIIREARIMQFVAHSNIIGFTGFSLERGIILSELAQASLHGVFHCSQMLPDGQELSLSLKIRWFLGIAKALQFLHFRDVIHGDIKPQNVLLVQNPHTHEIVAKVSDFGISIAVGSSTVGKSTMRAAGGSMPYMAPELIDFEEFPLRTVAVDIYSFGVLMNESMSGEMPWNNLQQSQIFAQIMKGKRPKQFQPSNECEREIAAVIGDASRGCLCGDVNQRFIGEMCVKMLTAVRDREVASHTGMTNLLAEKQKQERESAENAAQLAEKQKQDREAAEKAARLAEKEKQEREAGQTETAPMVCLAPFTTPQELIGHTKFVYSMALLLNGQLVTASTDKTLRFWNVSIGQCEDVWKDKKYGYDCIAALDLDRIVNISGTDFNSLCIYNIHNKQCLFTLTGHTGSIFALCALPNYNIVSGSGDKTIRIWNSDNGKCLKVFEGHTNYVQCVISLSNGKIASGSTDRTIRIWNVESGVCGKVLNGHTDTVNCLCVLSDGHLASGSCDSTIRIWDVETGNCLKVLSGHISAVYHLLSFLMVIW